MLFRSIAVGYVEAFAIYFRELKPNGVLAVHVSNRYLDLVPVVKKAADTFNRVAYLAASGSDEVSGLKASTWVLVGQREQLARFASLHEILPAPDVRPWTDDYSSLLGIMK